MIITIVISVIWLFRCITPHQCDRYHRWPASCLPAATTKGPLALLAALPFNHTRSLGKVACLPPLSLMVLISPLNVKFWKTPFLFLILSKSGLCVTEMSLGLRHCLPIRQWYSNYPPGASSSLLIWGETVYYLKSTPFSFSIERSIFFVLGIHLPLMRCLFGYRSRILKLLLK